MTREEIFDVIVAAAYKRLRGDCRQYLRVVDAAAVVADVLADGLVEDVACSDAAYHLEYEVILTARRIG